MRNMMMMNMKKMMGAQTPMIGDQSGMHAGMGAIREELDDKGRVVGRSFVPEANNGGGNNGMSDGMLRVIGEQNKILFQSQMDQMRDIFNNIFSRYGSTK
jgi:hypothetical protein